MIDIYRPVWGIKFVILFENWICYIAIVLPVLRAEGFLETNVRKRRALSWNPSLVLIVCICGSWLVTNSR